MASDKDLLRVRRRLGGKRVGRRTKAHKKARRHG